MKKIFIIIAAAISMASCTLEMSDNGDFDGYWQLSAVDTLATQGHCNMRDSGIYWAVQKDLVVTRATIDGRLGEILYVFNITADSLILHNPYVLYRDASDIKVTDVERLRRYGVNNLEEKFRILQFESGKMVLQSQMLNLYLRKY